MKEQEQQCIRTRLGYPSLSFVVRNVFEDPIDSELLEGVDALIIGGSGSYSVQDKRTEKFIHGMRELIGQAIATKLPAFAICFGHQLLGQLHGAKVMTDITKRESGTVVRF